MNATVELPEITRSSEPPEIDHDQRITLCETLDRVLNKGVVVAGELIISVAGVDLIYLNVQVLLASIETAYGRLAAAGDAEYGGGT